MATEYGIFTDEGCIETGFYDEGTAKAEMADRYADEEYAHVAALCPDHEEQAAATCEECFAEADDEDEED